MKLYSIKLMVPVSLPGLSMRVTDELVIGKGALDGWAVHVRGPRLILVGPPGWVPGLPKHEWKGGESVLFDLPREHVMLRWVGSATDVDNLSKWSPGPEVPVQTSAKPSALLSSAARERGLDGVGSGVALESDAAVDNNGEQLEITEAELAPKAKRR